MVALRLDKKKVDEEDKLLEHPAVAGSITGRVILCPPSCDRGGAARA